MEQINNSFEQHFPKTYEQVLLDIEAALDQGREKEYVAERLKELMASSEIKNLGIMYGRFYKGFIRPESKIQRSPMVDPFHIDDSELYEGLFENIKEFKQYEGWKDKELRAILPEVIQYTISKYFGNAAGTTNTDRDNQSFYLDHSDVSSEDLSIKELKGKRIAVCAEKATVAQNLVSFVGLESYIVLSECKLGEGKEQFHAYNILKTNKGYFIYDPTNPRLELEEGTNHLKNTNAAIYKITDEEFLKLENGGDVTVEHTDFSVDGLGKKSIKTDERVYSGPRMTGNV